MIFVPLDAATQMESGEPEEEEPEPFVWDEDTIADVKYHEMHEDGEI